MDANQKLIQLYREVRSKTEALCQPLAIEDYVVQSIDDVSPAKWHLAHTTWFFETFILAAKQPAYVHFDASFHHLFNSYYQSIGEPYPRVKRGILSRPTVEVIYAYRHYVDERMLDYLTHLHDEAGQDVLTLLTLGLNHEEQHQELLLMDIKHNFSCDPNFPVYRERQSDDKHTKTDLHFVEVQGGLIEMGHEGQGFCFDNELPRHAYHLNPYKMANRLVTNGEFAEFIAADGYQKPDVWLADGWDVIQKNKWQAPLYWQKMDGEWHVFTLSGIKKLNLNDPVVHVSYYEADAYARWLEARLPSEMEWEHFVTHERLSLAKGNFLEAHHFHPHAVLSQEKEPQQFFGDVWEWTMSPYTPYPGYKPAVGALGEYNGKFMNNQMVLRGGSCITPKSHVRATYRNFFQPDKRWQFSGIRLANHL